MPRFFFHLHNDLESADDEGRELPDIEAARRAAEQDARDMAAESVRAGHLTRSHFVEVAGEDGEPRFCVTFGEVVEIRE